MKRESEHITDELLIKYLAQEHSEAEGRIIEAWKNASDENHQYLAEMRQVWGMMEQMDEAEIKKADVAWDRFQKRVGISSASITHMQSGWRNNWMRIAAVILVGIASIAGIWALLQEEGQVERKMLVNQSSEPLRQELADGSVVHLKAGAILTYPPAFSEDIRRVELEGEAFFDIAKDSLHPFVIETNQTLIEVIGTSFLVRALAEEKATEVVVKTGIVAVRDKDQTKENSIILERGMAAKHDHEQSAVVAISPPQEAVDAWVPKTFHFVRAPMSQVVKTLSDAYGVEIRFTSKDEQDCEYSGQYNGQSLEEILTLISEAMGYHIQKTGNGYLMWTNSCT
ncbi:MAG: FecR domain-containing protein [Bacteroidota bacterium]